jgi:class 3 adenylate cyclase
VRTLEQIGDRDALLRRFAEGESLRLVQTAVGEDQRPVQPREIIVWFSDIANFSTWSKNQRAEVTAKLARKLAEIQIDLIREHGGMIDKLMGDGVMAIWFIDTQVEKKSAPYKAIRCAQAVVSAVLTELRSQKLDQIDKPLDIRIGMHCGKVAFGDFGAENRIAVTVLGDTVNLASRYEQAKPDEGQQLGRIRISPQLKDHIDKSPNHEPIPFSEKVAIKVKHDLPIEIFWL